MNKDVIYLEPEDDITDILTKLQQAEQKLVALVPPKKATMLRSAVNMKLVARVAKECEKVVVIVTADPAIVKMAMAARIPVAKTLQSRPVIPTEAKLKEAEADEDVIDEDTLNDKNQDLKAAKPAVKAASATALSTSSEDSADISLNEESLEESAKKAEKKKSKKTPKDPSSLNFFQKYQKWIMIGSAAAVILVVVLVWALVFAPAVQIVVAISSTPNNFSENVRFTTDENAQNLEENVLYAELIKLDKTYKTDIAATGEEDRGDKATGRLTATVSFRPREYYGEGGYGVSIAPGDRFKSNTNGLVYIATSGASAFWNGEDPSVECDNGTLTGGTAFTRTCLMSVSFAVEAEQGGDSYNLPASSSWAPSDGATISNGAAISGGTTNVVKVISDEDIDKVKDAQLAEHTIEGKEDILSDLGQDLIPIEASFKNEVTEVKTTPDKSDEVKDDDKPTAEVKITNSIYAVKRNTIDEYVKLMMTLSDDQKIYSFGSPYFERFTDIENEARLKTSVETGPTVTEEDILEKVKGMKTGQVAAALRAIDGVSSVNIYTSYFWVWSVPNDSNKISIKLEVEDK